MSDEWTDEDQERVVALRRDVSDKMQAARREGRTFFAWIFDKLADAALWIEREGKRLKRGF